MTIFAPFYPMLVTHVQKVNVVNCAVVKFPVNFAVQEFSLDGENNLFWLQNPWSCDFRKICVYTSLSLLVKNPEYLYL